MQQEILLRVDDAVAEIFVLMLGRVCIPQAGAPHAVFAESAAGFTASVRFSGTVSGACTVHLEEQAAHHLTEQLTGTPYSDLSTSPSLSADTVGEICNMIAGSWKSRLPPNLSTCNLSPPSVKACTSALSTLQPVSIHSLCQTTLTRFYSFEDHYLGLELSIA